MTTTHKNQPRRFYTRIIVGVCIVIAAITGYIIGTIRNPGTVSPAGASVQRSASSPQATLWTCSMHPHIKLPKQGKCPICFMDLIPLETSVASASGHPSDRRLVLSEAARQLAAIASTPAIRRNVLYNINLTGKIAVNESTVETIALRIGGRIDRLYVDYTGMTVRKGDHLADIYSPELMTLQQELITAKRSADAPVPGSSEYVRNNSAGILSAASEKLRLLGFSDIELGEILARGNASDHMTIRATQAGVVLERMASTGSYVESGMPLFKIADLRRVWVLLDAYESDLKWLRLGQKVVFEIEAFPGESFSGTVSFIDPTVDPTTRTVKVRVHADNTNLRLKPEMFVKATIGANVTASGKVVNRSLRGKWICPMHPEIVKNGPGTCDVCGMPIVLAESLGFVTSGFEQVEPLLIPATAPLFTGERAIVYVEVSSDSTGTTYEGREILLGARVGDYYVVKSGIAEGERVVVNGAFRIDSELQIRAQPSMMNPPSASRHAPAATATVNLIRNAEKDALIPDARFLAYLDALFDNYFAMATMLAADSIEHIKPLLERFSATLGDGFSGKEAAYAPWNAIRTGLEKALSSRNDIETITDARILFEKLSIQIISLQKKYGFNRKDRYLAFCPMAFNNSGAYWLQEDKLITNPYFGASMLRCGTLRETYAGDSGKGSAHGQ